MAKYVTSATVALIFSTFLTAGASAGTITFQTFDPVIPTVETQNSTPNAWYIDRYAPSEFKSVEFEGDNRLALVLSASDNSDGRFAKTGNEGLKDSFYSTQGRAFDIAGATSMSIDMFIANEFNDPDIDVDVRTGGIWGIAVDAANEITGYPIIEFFSQQFQVWDGIDRKWDAIGSVLDDEDYGEFYNLKISLDIANNLFHFFINGDELHSATAEGAKSIKAVILQGKNADPGVDRTLYFDNFEASVVPVPPALPLLGTGLALMGFLGWRKKQKATT